MSSEDADSKDLTVNKSRDSKWLLAGLTGTKEGRKTRKGAGNITPKVALRSSLRKKTKNSKSKVVSTSKSTGQAKTKTMIAKKRKLNNKNDDSSKKMKRKKKVDIESKAKKKVKSRENASSVKKAGTKRKMPVAKKKTKAEIVVGEDNVIHIKTGIVDDETADDKGDDIEGEYESEIQDPPKKRGRKQKAMKTEEVDDINVKNEPTENGFPTIEDELKLIEGEKLKAKARKAKAKAKKKNATTFRRRKPQEPTRHCNLCTESFYSELELAHHCKAVHFKTKFVFKDDGIAQILGGKENVKATDMMGKEHQYARDDDESKPNVYIEGESDEDLMDMVDNALQKSADKSSDDMVAAESVVFVRKVREEDKKVCQFCKKIFLSSKGLKDHIEMRCNLVPFRCYCGKGLKEPNELHTHYPNLQIPKYKSSGSRLECSKCGERFGFRETLQNHSLTCMADESSEGEDGQTPARNKAHTPKNKHYRKRYVSSDKSIVCDICGKSFASQGGLRTHREIHTDVKKYICEHCGSGFFQKVNLMQHLKTDIGPCKGLKGTHSVMMDCSMCKRSFTSVNRLKQHERKHQRLEELSGPDGLVCKDCGKSFTGFHQLQRHLMTHAGERPHKCKFCEKSFTQKSNMMAHMRIHTGYRPYECYICGQGFTQGTTLKIHVEKNHDIATYKFKKLPRGRKGKDTSVGTDGGVNVEEEYIQRALQDGSYVKTESKRGRGSSSNVRREDKENSNDKTREMSTQADDDEEDYYYDDESDDEDYDYYKRGAEGKTDPSSTGKVQVKDIGGRKLYFTVVDEKGDSHDGQHISIDTSTLSEAIKRSLYEPGLHPALDEAIQRTGYVQREGYSNFAREDPNIGDRRKDMGNTVHEAPHKNVAVRPNVLPRAVLADADAAIRRLSEEAVKRSFAEARKVVPATSEALQRFLTQQENMSRVTVSQVPKVVTTVPAPVVAHVPQVVSQVNHHQMHQQSSTPVVNASRVPLANVPQVQMISQPSSAVVSNSTNTIHGIAVPTVVDLASNAAASHTVNTIDGMNVQTIVDAKPDATELAPKIIQQINENIVSQQEVETETYEAVKYNPINEAETKEAIISLQNDQERVENNEDLVQKYQALEAVSEFNQTEQNRNIVIENPANSGQFEIVPEDEEGVEYVTVIFEDDGTETVEQEIDIASSSQSVNIGQGQVNIGQGHDTSYIRNVSDVVNSVVSPGVQGANTVVHISQ